MNKSFEKRLEVEIANAKTNRAARQAEDHAAKDKRARQLAKRRELDNANQERVEDFAFTELHHLAKVLASSLGLGCEIDDSSKPESLTVVFTGKSLGGIQSSSFQFTLGAFGGTIESAVTCRLPDQGKYSSFANFSEHHRWQNFSRKDLTIWFQEQSVAVAKFYLENAPID